MAQEGSVHDEVRGGGCAQPLVPDSAGADRVARLVLENVREVVFCIDENGRWSYLNTAWEALTGHSVESSIGRYVVDYLQAADIEKFDALMCRVQANEEDGASIALRVARSDGEFRWADMSCRLAETGDSAAEVCGTLHDVAEQKEIERAITAHRDFLRNVIDLSPNCIFVKDENGLFVLANKSMAAYYGTTPELIVGRTEASFNPNSREVATFGEIDRQVLATDSDQLCYQQRLEIDGETRWFQAMKCAIRAPEVGRRYVFGVATDITEMVLSQRESAEARREAQESSRLKSEFLSNMSHEIRTPMNGVIGMADLLLDSGLDAEQCDLAKTIRESADSLLAILNDILDFSKIEAGKMSAESLPVDLADLLERVAVGFALRAESKGLGFEIDIDWKHPWTYATDPLRLRQVLSNLIGNAVKFTNRGEIRVILEIGPKGFPVVHVQDSGIGIPRDRLDSVFGAFTQADGSITRKHGGTGLGLAIARELAALLGGSITVQSEPGAGSRFSLELDLPPVSSSFADERRLLGRRIAIVTDDSHVATAARGALLSLGAAVVSVDGDHDAVLFDARQGGSPPLGRVISFQRHGAASSGDAAAAIYEPLTRRALIDAVVRAMGSQTVWEATPSASLRPSRALLVEDNAVNQQVAIRLLEKQGLTVDVAATGLEAIGCTARFDYDLVIMDVQMPEMDGFEATRRIRERDDAVGRYVPILAITAHALKGDRERCLDAGMDDYLSKPLRREELEERVAVWVGPPQTEGICELDETYLLSAFGEDRDFLAEVLVTYVKSSESLLEGLRDALSKDDYVRTRSIAHTLKGSSRSIGAVNYAELCDRLEHAPSEDSLRELAQSVVRETPRMLAACRTRARRLLRGTAV